MARTSHEEYRREVENLFWDWYNDTYCQLWEKEQHRRLNDSAKKRASTLGILYTMRGDEMTRTDD